MLDDEGNLYHDGEWWSTDEEITTNLRELVEAAVEEEENEEAPPPQPGDAYVNFRKSSLPVPVGAITIQSPTPNPVQATPALPPQDILANLPEACQVADEICDLVKGLREENKKLKIENRVLKRLYFNIPPSPPKDQK